MGCDFYTIYQVCIEYTENGELKKYKYKLENTIDRHYWHDLKYDEDFEEWDEYGKRLMKYHEEQIEYVLGNDYPRIDLCVGGVWKCVKSAKEKYISIAKMKNISEDTIVNVWKEGTYWFR